MNTPESTLEVIVDRAGGYLHWLAIALFACMSVIVYQHPIWLPAVVLAATAVFAYHTIITRHHRIQQRVGKALHEEYGILPETTTSLPTRSGKEGHTYALISGKWMRIRVVFLNSKSSPIALRGDSEMEFSSVVE